VLDKLWLRPDENTRNALVILIVVEALFGGECLLVDPGTTLTIFTDLDAFLNLPHHLFLFYLIFDRGFFGLFVIIVGTIFVSTEEAGAEFKLWASHTSTIANCLLLLQLYRATLHSLFDE